MLGVCGLRRCSWSAGLDVTRIIHERGAFAHYVRCAGSWSATGLDTAQPGQSVSSCALSLRERAPRRN